MALITWIRRISVLLLVVLVGFGTIYVDRRCTGDVNAKIWLTHVTCTDCLASRSFAGTSICCVLEYLWRQLLHGSPCDEAAFSSVQG
eukprot:6210058-Pleurochrysis_carterae.AAC.3